MFTGQLDALRAQVSRIFRHGSKQEQSAALGKLEDDLAALTQQNANKADLTEQWSSLLFSYLTTHPEARGDIEGLASLPLTGKTTNIGSQHNYGSGIFIGGDNYGEAAFKGQR